MTVSEREISDFRALYEGAQGMIRSVIYNIAGGDAIDDLVQETWLKAWRGLPRFHWRARQRTWLYRIAVNTALDHCRARQRHKVTPLETDPPDPKPPEGDSETAGLIQQGLANLPEEQRSVVVLSLLEGLSHRDVAKVLNIATGTVKSRLHYGRQHLKDFLTKAGVTL